MGSPVITVAMPLRDAGSIAWLALTALTRQVDAPPWELLVIEDQTVDAVAAETWAFYGPLLGAAGCVRFELFKPEGWPALSEKWRVGRARPASDSCSAPGTTTRRRRGSRRPTT